MILNLFIHWILTFRLRLIQPSLKKLWRSKQLRRTRACYYGIRRSLSKVGRALLRMTFTGLLVILIRHRPRLRRDKGRLPRRSLTKTGRNPVIELIPYRVVWIVIFGLLNLENPTRAQPKSTFLSCHELQEYQKRNPQALWHITCPTTGLVSEEKIKTSYAPHLFSLWQLAPKKGAGITIALFDTGVAAFQTEHTWCKRHPQLVFPQDLINNYLNITKTYELESLATYIESITEINPENTQLISWINEYCINGSKKPMIDFITMHNKPLNLIESIVHGRRGIKPGGAIRFFSPIELQNPSGKAILELLPIAFSTQHHDIYCSHGTHMYGLINAQPISSCGVVGIAPNARCVMYKIAKEMGKTDTALLLKGLKEARVIQPDIINLSLKINETNKETLNELAAQLRFFNYSIAASGNELDTTRRRSLPYSLTQLPVTWTVGAYAYHGNSYTVAPFSQYQKGMGPHFVAPGDEIISTAVRYTNYKQENGYLCMSGTSMAAALMSGFLALILAEFQHDFTKEQILQVCMYAAIKLGRTPEWFDSSLYGVVDMRTALFMLWVARAIKEKKIVNYDFEKNFNHIITVIKQCLKDQKWALKNKKPNLSIIINYYANKVIDELQQEQE